MEQKRDYSHLLQFSAVQRTLYSYSNCVTEQAEFIYMYVAQLNQILANKITPSFGIILLVPFCLLGHQQALIRNGNVGCGSMISVAVPRIKKISKFYIAIQFLQSKVIKNHKNCIKLHYIGLNKSVERLLIVCNTQKVVKMLKKVCGAFIR